MITTPDDARDLLIAAGVSEREITDEAIQVAQIYNEALMRQVGQMLAERIIKQLFGNERNADQ